MVNKKAMAVITKMQEQNPDLEVLEFTRVKDIGRFRCKKCNNEFSMRGDSFWKRHYTCPICEEEKNKKTKLPDNTKNLVSEVRPDLIKFFEDKDLPYKRGMNSKEKTWFKCPECGEREYTSIRTFCKRAHPCKNCDNKAISMPNKILRALFQQIKNNFSYTKLEWNPKWAGLYRYDGYFETFKGEKIAIEMHGAQHYKEVQNWSVDNFKRDKEKTLLAEKNKIKLIVIDCRQSLFEFIKDNILKSELNNYIDFDKIDWIKIMEASSKSVMKEIADYFNSGMTTGQIRKETGFDYHTIRTALQNATEMGWCNYNAQREKEKKMKLVEIIDLQENNSFQMLCVNEVCRYFKEKYNIGLCPRIIKKRIEEKGEEWQKENPYHNRFIFKYIDKANDQQRSS